MSTVMVTGVNGFVGKHLVKELTSRDHKIIGVGFTEPIHPSIRHLVSRYYPADLTKSKDIHSLPLATIDALINLAGLAKVGDSFTNPKIYKKVNADVFENLCDALYAINPSVEIDVLSAS